jgi:hypothetical protein
VKGETGVPTEKMPAPCTTAAEEMVEIVTPDGKVITFAVPAGSLIRIVGEEDRRITSQFSSQPPRRRLGTRIYRPDPVVSRIAASSEASPEIPHRRTTLPPLKSVISEQPVGTVTTGEVSGPVAVGRPVQATGPTKQMVDAMLKAMKQ